VPASANRQAGVTPATFQSDIDSKEAIRDIRSDLDSFMQQMQDIGFRFKQGGPGSERAGVSAQSLEQSDLGQRMVQESGGRKQIDSQKALETSMAALSRLDERLRALEQGAGSEPGTAQMSFTQEQAQGDNTVRLDPVQIQGQAQERRPFGAEGADQIIAQFPGSSRNNPFDRGGVIDQASEDIAAVTSVQRNDPATRRFLQNLSDEELLDLAGKFRERAGGMTLPERNRRVAEPLSEDEQRRVKEAAQGPHGARQANLAEAVIRARRVGDEEEVQEAARTADDLFQRAVKEGVPMETRSDGTVRIKGSPSTQFREMNNGQENRR
jgi:hypothetical protein